MKALILSDIHSNIYALEAIWDQEKDSDIIYCTGDLVDYGPCPKEVLDWMRAHDVFCTQGNHDRWLVNTYRDGRVFDQIPQNERGWIHHNSNLLDHEDILYLESLPRTHTFQSDEISYGLAHLYQDYDEINNLHAFTTFRSQAFSENQTWNFTRLILGHTHRQGIHYLSDDVLWMNPGSVSYRRLDDPDQSAHYGTISDGRISLKRIPYDLAPLHQKFRGISLRASENRFAERFFGERKTKG